jgi:hypothetical protein
MVAGYMPPSPACSRTCFCRTCCIPESYLLTLLCVSALCSCRVYAAIASLFQDVCVRFLEERTDRALARCRQDEAGESITLLIEALYWRLACGDVPACCAVHVHAAPAPQLTFF